MIRYRHSTCFVVIKTGLVNLCSPSTGHRVVKTGLLTLHRLLTGNAETKTGIKILYRLWTSPAVVKTSLAYRPSISFGVVKTAFLNLYKIYLANTYKPSQALQLSRCARWPSTSFNSLCGSQKMHHDPLQAFIRFCSSQNGLSEHLQSFTRQCSSQNWQDSWEDCHACFDYSNAYWEHVEVQQPSFDHPKPVECI